MIIGNIVRPTKESKFQLRSGAEAYDNAVVISVEPFILTSTDSTMKWESTVKKDDFEVVGTATANVLQKCMRRLHDGHVEPTLIEYWKTRCILAEIVIEKTPCDPDVTPEQIHADAVYKQFLKDYGTK